MLGSLFNKVAGLTPILKNICQPLPLHCTPITHCYLFVLLYDSAPSSSLSLLLLLISPMFVFRSNSKGFKEFKSGISFCLFHWGYFLFPCFFCLSQFCLKSLVTIKMNEIFPYLACCGQKLNFYVRKSRQR